MAHFFHLVYIAGEDRKGGRERRREGEKERRREGREGREGKEGGEGGRGRGKGDTITPQEWKRMQTWIFFYFRSSRPTAKYLQKLKLLLYSDDF